MVKIHLLDGTHYMQASMEQAKRTGIGKDVRGLGECDTGVGAC